MREDNLSGVNELHAEIIGQLAVRHRVWAYRVYKEVIDLEFKLGAIACVVVVVVVIAVVVTAIVVCSLLGLGTWSAHNHL